jgi:hypothetical protein
MVSSATVAGVIHPALDQALDVFPANIASRAAAALRSLLYERITADGERAWSSSRLTGDGFPVEITFTTADNRLRYTVEPASCDLDPGTRRDVSVQLINSLCPTPLPEGLPDAFQAIQAAGDLSFGAWLGGRHSADESQYKIYVETPNGAGVEDRVAAVLGAYPQPQRPARGAELRMIAYSPGSKQCEIYFRMRSLAAHHVPGLLVPLGFAAKSEELLRYLKDAYGFPLGERLPGPSVGVSYTWRVNEPPQAVSLFFFARSLWGGDARIRQQFGRLSRALGWNDSSYQKLTTPLATRRSWKTYHGILGMTLTRSGQMALSIGVRPRAGLQESGP